MLANKNIIEDASIPSCSSLKHDNNTTNAIRSPVNIEQQSFDEWHWNIVEDMTLCQKKVFDFVEHHIDHLPLMSECGILSTKKPPQLLLLIIGGPGVGKSYLTKCIDQMIHKLGKGTCLCTSKYGGAAKNVGGATNASIFHYLQSTSNITRFNY